MRTRDVDILKGVYMPLLVGLGERSPIFSQAVKEEKFWEYFNGVIIDAKAGSIELFELFRQYKIEVSEKYLPLLEELKKEYISQLASEYLNGSLNSKYAIILLSSPAFVRELDFQTKVKQAITLMERAILKKKLSLLEEAAKFEIADSEVTSAFEALDKKKEFEELKKKLRGWDAQSDAKKIPERASFHLATDNSDSALSHDSTKNSKRKARSTVALMFLRLAAAAAIGLGAIWGGYELYKQFTAGPNPPKQPIPSSQPDTFKNLLANSFVNDTCYTSVFKKIERPHYSRSNANAELIEIEVNDCFTIVSFKHVSDEKYGNGGWCQFYESAYIIDTRTKKKYKFIKADGISVAPEKVYLSDTLKHISFKVFFEALDSSVTRIDIVECEEGNCFNFYGVELLSPQSASHQALKPNVSQSADRNAVTIDTISLKDQPKYRIVQSNSKYGVVDYRNDTVISCKFESITIYPYKDSTFFIVEDKGKFGAVDIKGKSFVPIVHRSVQYTKNIVMILLGTKKDTDFQIGVDPNKAGPR